MASFSSGQLFVREFSTLTAAHVFAGEVASRAVHGKHDLRLIEVAPTAAGAWVCGWKSKDPVEGLDLHDTVDSSDELLNALLSLGPKPSADLSAIEILEGSLITDVLQAAQAFVAAGHVLLEVRVKKSGAVGGAYAFVETRADGKVPRMPATVVHTRVPLVGDYRRYFV